MSLPPHGASYHASKIGFIGFGVIESKLWQPDL
jgi:hypothetical protein